MCSHLIVFSSLLHTFQFTLHLNSIMHLISFWGGGEWLTVNIYQRQWFLYIDFLTHNFLTVSWCCLFDNYNFAVSRDNFTFPLFKRMLLNSFSRHITLADFYSKNNPWEQEPMSPFCPQRRSSTIENHNSREHDTQNSFLGWGTVLLDLTCSVLIKRTLNFVAFSCI